MLGRPNRPSSSVAKLTNTKLAGCRWRQLAGSRMKRNMPAMIIRKAAKML